GLRRFSKLVMSILTLPTIMGLSTRTGTRLAASVTQMIILSSSLKIVTAIVVGFIFMVLNLPYFVVMVSFPRYRTNMVWFSLSKNIGIGILSTLGFNRLKSIFRAQNTALTTSWAHSGILKTPSLLIAVLAARL